MIEDKVYCMSSFLMYRIISDRNKCFSLDYPPKWESFPGNRKEIFTSCELEKCLREKMQCINSGKRCGLALSGGIDSAILLSFMPDDSIVYTFKCVVPGIEVIDESPRAAEYIKASGKSRITHKIIPIYWDDMESMSIPLMKQKGAPIHSIEVQIYKAALQAKEDGCDTFIFGETADCIYGGHSNLLSKDWSFGDFVDLWSFLLPYKVLHDFVLDVKPFEEYEKN